MAVKCPNCGLTQMPRPTCKSCGTAQDNKVPRSTAAQASAQQPISPSPPKTSLGETFFWVFYPMDAAIVILGWLAFILPLYQSGWDDLVAAVSITLFIVIPLLLFPPLAMFSYRKQPAKLTQELPVIRIESFPKSNGPQIAGVITRYTGMYGVDDLLNKLPVEFEVEAETSEDLKSQLQQLGCN